MVGKAVYVHIRVDFAYVGHQGGSILIVGWDLLAQFNVPTLLCSLFLIDLQNY